MILPKQNAVRLITNVKIIRAKTERLAPLKQTVKVKAVLNAIALVALQIGFAKISSTALTIRVITRQHVVRIRPM